MATIKAIEARSVHQIQSGQVIVDLCSVVKELVENSLDAGATAIEVRFKNNGLDAIEVQDNGAGIAPENYECIALKHFTSKLSSYDDLSTLHTFGFRGEALSSLCALSKFSILTAQTNEAPKGKRLELDALGRLNSTSVAAAQRGTTATVENLFETLPVRRKELSKNIKREYGKVLGQLHAYACIGINVKFTVKNTMPKSKSMTVFATKGNATTRENIANVYGAKTLGALVELNLDLEYQPTLTQMARKEKHTSIHVQGHISRPVFGEGRQTPDRQMFFVNGRPCGLPQIAKAINEVYKAFNVSQSPFIFADLRMDTNAYDVNVSPDKRTILIHDSALLVENLKIALDEMFEQQEQTVPQSQLVTPKLPAFQKLNLQRQAASRTPEVSDQHASSLNVDSPDNDGQGEGDDISAAGEARTSIFQDHFQNFTSTREEIKSQGQQQEKLQKAHDKRAEKIARKVLAHEARAKQDGLDEFDDMREIASIAQPVAHPESDLEDDEPSQDNLAKIHARDFNARMVEAQSMHRKEQTISEQAPRPAAAITSVGMPHADSNKGSVPDAFDRMRPKRLPAEIATVTVGDQTFTTILGSQFPRSQGNAKSANGTQQQMKSKATPQFSQQLRKFGAQGSEPIDEADDDIQDEDEEDAGQVEITSHVDSDEEEPSVSAHIDTMTRESPSESDNEVADEVIPEQDSGHTSDADYIDDDEKKRAEEAKVAELIKAAEASSAMPSKENLRRATKTLAGGHRKDATTHLLALAECHISSLLRELRQSHAYLDIELEASHSRADVSETAATQDPEARLSLTVSKSDFAKMNIVGQFNLGFILAVRPTQPIVEGNDHRRQDELFIIDQHASDEKYNFERLQAETMVGNQRLVRPVVLDLTAVEEEIVLENNDALEKNGFLVEIDTSGESMVGQRCSVVSLPLSREVVFSIRDLEELIHLLADSPVVGESRVPRPSKVRKMFAMRACRSSIMIGKTLSKKQMQKVVAHMGTIDKPWNCPHGRPTMRHLCSLNTLRPWREGSSQHQEDQLSLGEALHRYMQDA